MIAEHPDVVDAREWIRLARAGDFEAAWHVSDRILARNGEVLDCTTPRHFQGVWDGRGFAGRRVLIRCYHGLGDTIQFIRYAALVQLVAREVIVWAQPALLPLLGNAPGVDRLLPLHDGSPDADYDIDIEIMELPYAFRTTLSTIPRCVPYLAATPRPIDGRRPCVGIVWRAGEWDVRRSMPFRHVAALLDARDVSWYALQLDPRPHEHAERLIELDTRGVIETAGAMSALDLVISIDSMSAHLAGALGLPVWTLLAHEADWRWMADRDDSPWHPTMRLFRQAAPGDWESVVVRVRRSLAGFRPATKRTGHCSRQSGAR